MKILAINGSPKKNKNTATLLNKALEGAASQGAETELVHLKSHFHIFLLKFFFQLHYTNS
jgi:multimeric flavodoxin WrbA